MRTSRTIPPAVYLAEQRFNALVDFAVRERSVAQLAHDHDCAPSTLYQQKHRVLHALTPKRPGPKPGLRAEQRRGALAERRICQLQHELDSARRALDRRASLDTRARRALLLTCSMRGLTLRGCEELFDRLGYSQGNAKSTLAQELVRLGQHARRVLSWCAHSLAPSITVAAGDEVFFHGDAVQVLMEPRSAAVLDLLRWGERGCDEWIAMLADFPAIQLFVSDAGRDLCAAGNKMGIALGADLIHEQMWFTKVFKKLSAREAAIVSSQKEASTMKTNHADALERLAALEGERAQLEAGFYGLVAVQERLHALFRPLDTEGKRWTLDTIWRCLTAAIEELERHRAELGERLTNKVRKHIELRGLAYAGHAVLWDSVDVTAREGATWSRDRILDALIERVRLRGQSRDETRSRYDRYLSERALAALDGSLSAQVEDIEAATSAVRLLLKRPARSSSLLESFNSRLRVLQTSRRNVSDALVALLAVQWNASRREEGPRRDESPWQTLGLIAKEDERGWVDILLDTLPDD
jgi:hypothetical protein